MPRKRLTFPKARRLTKPSEFAQVRKNGRAERGQLIVLSVLPIEDRQLRAGFVTSRAVGSAVKRNRVRRKLREIVRKHQHELNPGNWVVTIARSNAAMASYEQLEGEWLRLAKRASILGA